MAITTPSDRTRWDTPSPPSPPEPPPNLDRPPRRRGYLIAAIITVAVVAAVVVAGLALTSGNNKKVATTTPPASTPIASTPQATTPATVNPTSAPQPLTAAAVIADYKAAQQILFEDAEAYPANPFDPRLDAHMTGAELHQVQNALTGLRIRGQHGQGSSYQLSPVVTSIGVATAMITDCSFDHTSIVDGRTGAVVTPADTVTTKNVVTLSLAGGTWKISDSQRVGTGCVPSA